MGTSMNKYIDLVYNWKSEYASIPDLQLRKQQVASKLGIEIPTGVTHEKEIIEYLNKQSHYRYTLLISRMQLLEDMLDRKSTRLNSSHVEISYAVFCLKKKKKKK